MKLTTYLEVSAAAGMGYDTETNEPVEVYAHMAVDYAKELSAEEIEEAHALHIRLLAKELEISPEHLRRISYEESLENTEGAVES